VQQGAGVAQQGAGVIAGQQGCTTCWQGHALIAL